MNNPTKTSYQDSLAVNSKKTHLSAFVQILLNQSIRSSVMGSFYCSLVFDLIQDFLERSKSLVIDEVSQVLSFDSEQEMETLQRKLLNAQLLLESCQPTANRALEQWVGDMTNVCYDVEDLVDDIKLSASRIPVLGKVWTCVKSLTTSKKVKDLQDKLEAIVRSLETIAGTRQQFQPATQEHRTDKVLILPQQIFGRDQDNENVVTMLLKNDIRSVSVVGMGGLGKTALVQNVLADSEVRARFSNIIWVSVSANFDLIKVSEKILHQRRDCEPSNKKKRVEYSYNYPALLDNPFEGKRVLIVLDDVWDVKYDDWSKLCDEFLRDSDCKFLLTTRNSNVSSATRSTTYYLQTISDNDCEHIIKDKSLSHCQVPARQLSNLNRIARAVAQKCKGLPLVAHIMGLYLSTTLNEDDWIALSDRDICDWPLFREQVFPAFRLNNPEFASHLKRCLAYCSLFPHNYGFKKDYLVQLWMAENFILPQRRTSLEKVGGDYFEELIGRCIFLHPETGDDRRSTYTMHEFVHRFAELVAFETCFRVEEGQLSSSTPLTNKIRHLSLVYHTIKTELLKAVEKCESLRTILLLSEHRTEICQIPYSLFLKLQRLRVLNLSKTNVDKLPESIGKLKHLRYLDVSETPIKKLPESTSGLNALIILRLSDCSELMELPRNTKDLTNLQHLDVNTKKLRSMPASLGSLTCLQTLPIFIVGRRDGNRVTELKNLKLLHGTLSLRGLQNVRNGAEAEEARLSEKPHVKRLDLEWSRTGNGTIAKDILGASQPHINLEELQLTNYGGSRFPDWFSSPSCRLVSIHLKNCGKCDELPTFGELPFLKTLHIEGLHGVKRVHHSFCGENVSEGFPLLESLKIQGMNSLERWFPFRNNSVQKLRDLTIQGCPTLMNLPLLENLPSLQTLEIIQCPQLISLDDLPASLHSLIIIESDLLKSQCRFQPDEGCDEGPEWSFVKAIPYVEIDYIELSSRSSN